MLIDRDNRHTMADIRESRIREEKSCEATSVMDIKDYLYKDAGIVDPKLIQVRVGKSNMPLAVEPRNDGRSKPRVMIADITAHELNQLTGPYEHQVELARRVDSSELVARYIKDRVVEIGIVSQLPTTLVEGVGVILDATDQVPPVYVLGIISSRIA